MTILTMVRSELEAKVGKITPEVEETITRMGTPIEEVTATSVSIEVFPNRPDLLCLENFAKALNQYRGKDGFVKIKVLPPEKDYIVNVDKSVKSVRPYTVCMIVKNLKFSPEKISSLIDVQEKLHGSIGRKRKKLAIGIYPLDKIRLPITFMAKAPEEISFIPLESSVPLKGSQILKMHPTGKEYAHLLEGKKAYPIFVDASGQILSMPPIINSEQTGRVQVSTQEVFVECSGDNLHYLSKALSILALCFSEMGGKIYAMHVKDKGGNLTTPEMEPEQLEFDIKDLSKTLGISLSEKEVRNHLAKMGIGFEQKAQKSLALVPSYRTDILHWVDLAEEIAIAIGYENFEPVMPSISTIANEDVNEKQKRVIATIIAGLGFQEVSTFHLTTRDDIKKMHFDFSDFIDVENSKNERNSLRIDLLTNHLQILHENSDVSYPHKIFELGRVFAKDLSGTSEAGVIEDEHLSVSISQEQVTFTEIKQVLDYLFKMLDKEYALQETENANFIPGRVGKILYKGKSIGFMGEIAPRVLKNWKIKMPVVSLEISLQELLSS